MVPEEEDLPGRQQAGKPSEVSLVPESGPLEQWEEVVREAGDAHLGGATSVVADGEKVVGVEGIRLIDASIPPCSDEAGGEIRETDDSQVVGATSPGGVNESAGALFQDASPTASSPSSELGQDLETADSLPIRDFRMAGPSATDGQVHDTELCESVIESQLVGFSVVGDDVPETGDSHATDVSHSVGSPTHGVELQKVNNSELEVHDMEALLSMGASPRLGSPTAGDEVRGTAAYQGTGLGEMHAAPMVRDEFPDEDPSAVNCASKPIHSPTAGDESLADEFQSLHAQQAGGSPMGGEEVRVTEDSEQHSVSKPVHFPMARDDSHEKGDTELLDVQQSVGSPVGEGDIDATEDPETLRASEPEALGSPVSGGEIHGIEDSEALDARLANYPVGDAVHKGYDSEVALSPPLAALPDENEEKREAEEEAEEGPAELNRGKRKRGRPGRSQARISTRRKEEEDVCFICFDGGNLVLCDRRGCPKAYHPSCVNRDEAFFRSKGKWNCGWHICSNCEKAAKYMCYTCTFSLCKGCLKEAEFFCVRGNKGFCETCMRTVRLIENNGQENTGMEVNFDDKSSWEYLFKEYWLDLKRKLSLTSDELTRAKNPAKATVALSRNDGSSDELYDAKNEAGSCSDSSSSHVEGSKSTRKKSKKRLRSTIRDQSSPHPSKAVDGEQSSVPEEREWASKELLEFVSHMKDGDTSGLTQYDVQALLLEYIKRNKLRDPRRKSQILCDSRLMNLFGKPRVGHFEMLKLLESHFLIKDDPSAADPGQEGVIETEATPMEIDGDIDGLTKTDKRRRKGRKAEERVLQTNLDDYAAIDVHNINLIYLRRNLMEDLLEDMETFQEKVVGAFVRIRISGAGQKQDMYRLVQVVGIGKAAEVYKAGKKTTDVTLEILNLNKTEIISIDTISNQEFSEEECKRLRQSIKCGFINRLSVGEVQVKARALQAVRVNDWLETETLRLSHLRDRASEKGRRKELRECVEKLQVLSSHEERSRRLQELPEVHADPNMDPSHDSEEETNADDKGHDNFLRPRDTGYSRRGRETVPANLHRASTNWEQSRTTVMTGANWEKGDLSAGFGEKISESYGNEARDASYNSGWDNLTGQTIVSSQPVAKPATQSTVTTATPAIDEMEKMWHYQDPSGKVQGPFSMTQLRKWSATGYFPGDLRIWKTSEGQNDSVLLTDALAGRFPKDLPEWEPHKTFYSGNSVSDVREFNSQDGWSADKAYGSPALKVDEKNGWTGNPSQGWGLSKGSANSDWPNQFQSQHLNSTPSYKAVENQRVGEASRFSSGQSCINMWNTDQSAGFQSNNHIPLSQPEASSMDRDRPPLTITTEVWSPQQARGSDNPGPPTPTPPTPTPPTPTPGLSSGGWMGVQKVTPGWGSAVVMGAPQSTSASNQIAGGWGQAAPVLMPVVGNELFEPPSPTPKSNSSQWGNSPNPGGFVHQISPVQLDSKSANCWDQPLHNSDGSSGDQFLRSDQIMKSSNNDSYLHMQQHSELASKDLRQGSVMTEVEPPRAPLSAPAVTENFRLSDKSLPQTLLADQPLQSNSPNLVSLHNPSLVQALPHGWGPLPPQNTEKAGLSHQPTLGPAGAHSNLVPLPANGTKQASTGTRTKPSRWGPAVNDAESHIPNTSLVSSANWQPSSANPATGWGATQQNPSKTWGQLAPEGSRQGAAMQVNTNGGWGATTQGNANGSWGSSENRSANSDWGSAAEGSVNTSWSTPSGQMQSNAGWGAAQGNTNGGWGAPAGSSSSWGGKQNQNAERFSGQWDQGFQASESGQSSGRQSKGGPSFGGGRGSGPPNKGQKVCKYHESGHCRKGSACDYLHT